MASNQFLSENGLLRRLRFALYISLAGFAAVAIGLSSFLFVDRQAEALRESRLSARVETTAAPAAALDNWFKGARAQATALAAALQPWPSSSQPAAQARLALDRMLPAASSFDSGAYVVDPAGRVVASSGNDAALMHLDRKSPWVDAALTGGAAVSSMHKDGLTRLDLVAIATPIKDQAGKVSGVLITSTRLLEGPFAESLASIPVPEAHRFFLSTTKERP